MAERSTRITLEATLGVFEGADDPRAPFTASEVADELGCVRRTAYGKLERLAERGDLRTKKVGARGRIWWQADPGPTAVERSETSALSAAQFEEFVDTVADYAIFVLDAGGHVRTWNDGAERIKGYEVAEIRGEHFSAFYTPEDREAGVPQRNLETAAEEGRVEDEGERLRKDGTTFWANVVITALYDDDGDVRGFVKVTRDMTERHEYETRLRDQRDELDELNQINAVIRDVDHALVTATTRDEIDQVVCDRLAASDIYTAAWTGEYTEAYEDVTPRASAGLDEAYLEAIAVADADRAGATEGGAGAIALRTRTVQSIDRICDNDVSEPWQEDTLSEGFESAVVIPLVYNDVEHGVLTVYAERESAFDERKVAVLREMGETASHAISAIRRKERERTLTALQESTRDLLYTESPEEIGDVIVDAVVGDLGLADAVVYLFDTSENKLEPVSASFTVGSHNGRPESLAAGDDSPIWSSFVDDEPRTLDADSTPIVPSRGLGRGTLALPLGNHGVLVASTDEGGTFDEKTRNLVEVVGTTAESAFDRVESQANLRARDEILQERNQRLQRLNHINTLIREVDQALVQATTHEEVQRVVCERLADSERFRFVWIGQPDEHDGGLVPQAWSGTDRGYLDSVPFQDGADPTEPAIRTARSEEVTVVSNVAADLRSGQWRKEAFSREFQSVISVPLAYDTLEYGVLTVYADRLAVFDEMERAVFAELGGTIANTLSAVETKQSLLSDEWVELEFRLGDESTSFLSRLADQAGCDVAFEGMIPLSEDRVRLFFTVDDVDPDVVREVIGRSLTVESSRLIASTDERHLFETVVGGSTLSLTLLEHGASVRTLTVTDDGITVVVELPSNSDTREFIERFQTHYDSAEFVARRSRERPAFTRRGFRAELEDNLTDRQLEVLQTAYYSGFFASPRRCTGTDVAEILDVSQPTVTEHLRAAQRKLLNLLLTDGPANA